MRRLRGAAEGVAAIMAAAVFSIFLLKILLRYCFDLPLAWADEVCTILFVWIIFWVNAFLVPERKHIAFDLLVRALPPMGQRVAGALRRIIVGGLFAAALPGAAGYIHFLWREHTPVLQLRLDLVYSCFAIFMAGVVVRSAAGLVRCRPA